MKKTASDLRVLFISRKWPPAVGGMETYSVEVVRMLQARTRLTYWTLPGRRNGLPPSLLSLFTFFCISAFRIIFQRRQYDVVHAGDMVLWPLLWIARLRNRKSRLVLSAHGTDVAMAFRQGLIADAYRIYLTSSSRIAHLVVIANSRATARLLENLCFGNVVIAPLAAHTQPVEPREKREPYILFVGRLIQRKGCGWFIDKVLPHLDEAVRLKIAGTIIDSEEGLAVSNSRVDFLGPIFGEELKRLRRNALAVVVPNIDIGPRGFEGFGLTTVEAAATGAIVVASDLDGIKDAIVPRRTGFLVKPNDEIAWSSQLNEILSWSDAHRERFINQAMQIIKDQYSWERVTDDIIRAYHLSTQP